MIPERLRRPPWVYLARALLAAVIVVAVIYFVFDGGPRREPVPPNPNLVVPQEP